MCENIGALTGAGEDSAVGAILVFLMLLWSILYLALGIDPYDGTFRNGTNASVAENLSESLNVSDLN